LYEQIPAKHYTRTRISPNISLIKSNSHNALKLDCFFTGTLSRYSGSSLSE